MLGTRARASAQKSAASRGIPGRLVRCHIRVRLHSGTGARRRSGPGVIAYAENIGQTLGVDASDELHGNESPAERATDAEVSPATAVDEVMDGSRACDVGYIVDIVLEDVGVTGHQRVGAGTLECCVEFREVRIAAAGGRRGPL